MKVKYNNELGQISANMNVMLDNIDKLSKKNYKAQKRYYDSEIVRQKTEIFSIQKPNKPSFSL